jgi:hypothetical protein
MKSAFEWVDSGVPMISGKPDDRDRFVRWVAEIQEDATKCYEITAAIEEVEASFGHLLAEVDLAGSLDRSVKGALGVLEDQINDLAKLKLPVEEP